MSNNLTLQDRIDERRKAMTSMEEVLGKGLNQPFNASNSGARKILYGTQSEHIVPSLYAEIANLQTGFENRFGDLSASIVRAGSEYTVTAIIPKFMSAPKQHYYIIYRDDDNGQILVQERTPYEHTTEMYGYMYNNSFVDSLTIGSKVKKDTIIRKSTSYDEFENRKDGCNIVCAYIGSNKNTEDSIIISESTAEKFSTPFIKKVTIIFNDNDIPLNLYGNSSGAWKSFPNIGEHVSGGILCGIRRENKEDALFTQSVDKLGQILMSDLKYTVEGVVVDLNIYNNDPSILDRFHYSQLKYYNDEHFRCRADIVSAVDRVLLMYPHYKMTYELQKLYIDSKRVLSGTQYIKDDKIFSNTIIEMIVIEKKKCIVGDKLTDRYGGKGVISYIFPDHLMPRTSDLNEPIGAIINQATVTNRENPGQLMETSINHKAVRLLYYIRSVVVEVEEARNLISQFMRILSTEQADAFDEYTLRLDQSDLEAYMTSILDDNKILISLKPISENITIDILDQIDKTFPWLDQTFITIPTPDSNGNIRYIPSRRKLICGRKYMFRLKQFAEEKFSATSLSSTNNKNQNTKNKASKTYTAIHSTTPVMLGTMENDNLGHLGEEHVVTNLMINSVSPKARRLTEHMLTGDPYAINIQLDAESTNRNVEILNTYLKTKGCKLNFRKIRKERHPLVSFSMVNFDEKRVKGTPLVKFVTPGEVFDYKDYYTRKERLENETPDPLAIFNMVSFKE